MESLLSPPKRSMIDPSIPLSATYFSSANYHGGFYSPKRSSYQERKEYDYPVGYHSSSSVSSSAPTMLYRNSLNDRVNLVSSIDQTSDNNNINNDNVANMITSSFQDTK
jgi:hypothetical protein